MSENTPEGTLELLVVLDDGDLRQRLDRRYCAGLVRLRAALRRVTDGAAR